MADYATLSSGGTVRQLADGMDDPRRTDPAQRADLDGGHRVSARVLDWVVAGVVNDDPLVKIRLVQYLVITGIVLSIVGVAISPGDSSRRVFLVVSRVLLCILVGWWLSRQTTLRFWQLVALFGGLPAASGLVTISTGAGASLAGRTAWAVLMPTLGGVMYGRRVAIWSAALTLTAITVADVIDEPAGLAALNVVGYVVVLIPVIFIVSETAVRLRAAVLQLQQTQADRDLLQHSLDDAADRERARIATELHDDTIQVMTAATMRLDMAQAKQPTVGGKPFDLGEPLELMQEAIARARRLSFDLYPPALDNGLQPALKEIAHRIERDAGFAVVVDVTPERFAAKHERLVYRTAKELLENARKHSQAELLELTVRIADSALVLLVADNGRGFDAHSPPHPGDGNFHFGLRAAEERVRRAGGTLTIDSIVGVGTTAELRLPVTTLGRSAPLRPEAAHEAD